MKEKSINAGLCSVMMWLCVCLALSTTALGQSDKFTYQGRLAEAGQPVNGLYDISFGIFQSATGGSPLFSQVILGVTVTNGVFTVEVNINGSCPNCFAGGTRFLELAVRPHDIGSLTTLSPRQPINSTPYAIKSGRATTADLLSVNCVSCVSSSQIASVNGSAVAGTIPVASVPSGSASYIQNTNVLQSSSNFSISGNGTVLGELRGGSVSSFSNFRLGTMRVLDANGPYTLAELSLSNTFLGESAGVNTTPSPNTIDQGGKLNSFFGAGAGKTNVGGNSNSFFGTLAGTASTNADYNSFFGTFAGQNNTLGEGNVFIGYSSGDRNTGGHNNALVGYDANFINTNNSNDGNTLLGAFSRASSSGPTGRDNATAIGFRAQVDRGNSIVLGSISGINGCTANNDCDSVNVGIGTTQPVEKLHIAVNGGNILLGTGGCNSGQGAISFATTVTGCDNYSLLGDGTATVINRAPGGSIFFRENNVTQMVIMPGGNVGLGAFPSTDRLQVKGTVRIDSLGAAGSAHLCINDSNQVSTCSSSARYKSNVKNFGFGLNLVRQLRPVSFSWKQSGTPDLGLVAEDVAKVEPLLTTKNDKGEIEGVKYDRVSVVLVNAVNEQQAQIQWQQKQIAALQEHLRQQHELIVELKTQLTQQIRKTQRRTRR